MVAVFVIVKVVENSWVVVTVIFWVLREYPSRDSPLPTEMRIRAASTPSLSGLKSTDL